jgi:hypothetical protein
MALMRCTRRALLIGCGLTAASLALLPVPARAAEPLEVAAASRAVGAIVAAEGGDAVRVVVDAGLAPAQIRVGGRVVDVAGTILLKPRFLDDPRNATKLGANIRRALVEVQPALAPQFEANHRAWAHPFARRVLAWNARLAGAGVRGKRVADVHGRAALLEWAGAVVDAGAPERGPAALARVPADAAAPTLEAYVAYVEALVAALT